MEFKQIKELVTLVNSTDITDLEIEDGEFRIRIRKEEKVVAAQPMQIAEGQVSLSPPNIASFAAPLEQAAVRSAPREHGLVEVAAPMVGTFYRSPAPDAAPYVQVGDSIVGGQILYIIEAMKMMNEIQSEVKGVVKQILVENGEPVEYGQPLLLIEPRA